MTLRMHPVSTARWEQLAASRHPIDLPEEEAREARQNNQKKGPRNRSEHAEIQAEVEAIAAKRTRATR